MRSENGQNGPGNTACNAGACFRSCSGIGSEMNRNIATYEARANQRRATRASAAILALGLFAPLIVGPATPAFASGCVPTTTNHCYGVYEWDMGVYPTYGGAANLLATSLFTQFPDNCDFATNELWVTPDLWTDWVEEGQVYADDCYSDVAWFWADQRPNGGGYHEHWVSQSYLSTSYDAKIWYAGSSRYYLYRDGTQIGTSTSEPGPVNALESGNEVDGPVSAVHSHTHTLQWIDSTNHTHSYWGSYPGLYSDPPQLCSSWGTTTYLDFYVDGTC
jgi:hypothetical protein